VELTDYFRIQTPQVISETIDGETIIINLESGHYFSLNHSGGQVWNDIQAGFSARQIEEMLLRCYPQAGTTVSQAVSEFLKVLVEESLVVPAEAPSHPPLPSLATGESDRPFEKPALQKYEDMQDLLLLDPIHEVDEMGWPIAK
jgi:hypothetical protein